MKLLQADKRDVLAALAIAQLGFEFGLENTTSMLRQAFARDTYGSLGARLGLAFVAFAQYEQSGDESEFETCDKQLKNVLAIEPDNPHALAQAVLLYLARSEHEQQSGHSSLAQAICQSREPTHATLAASCAEEAWRRGDPTRARALFIHATQADPQLHGAWMQHAMLEFEAGNIRSAQQFLERAIESPWPSIRISARATLGATLDQLGDTPGAIAAYRSARELCDRTKCTVAPDLLFNLGLALSRVGDDEAELAEARAVLEQVSRRADLPQSRKLRVEQALRELDSIRAEHERAKR